MIKIKAFNIVLTAAAFSAVFLLLPADKDNAGVTENHSQSYPVNHGVTQKANQQTIRGHFLHSA
ncbi:hypothetical protein NP590_08425 [Methylomonas sp. SURF-2]|uniref:Uncharacterized protein n=1 Tax=Methylomonas subterranea TaxID=2952225 RepID=A0ABT1TF82_9GAMM|nr:hypothetical protein [Methylomonas sp. SURF-2]MCQ8104126.1 hypothetical protein [Methylomonas sp. SURF-2]